MLIFYIVTQVLNNSIVGLVVLGLILFWMWKMYSTAWRTAKVIVVAGGKEIISTGKKTHQHGMIAGGFVPKMAFVALWGMIFVSTLRWSI